MGHTLILNNIKNFLKNLYIGLIPNKSDNFTAKILKILILIFLVIFIASSAYLINYYFVGEKQKAIIEDTRDVWYTQPENSIVPPKSVVDILLKQNSDFKGWITIKNTQIDNPIYQTTDNNFYLTNNLKKEPSRNGALFFDCDNVITEAEVDKNLVIYGHHMKNGTMFATLTKYKNINFYKENPTIEFSTLYKKSTYKIYAAFLLNAVRADDNNYLYDISCNNFFDARDFDAWVDEARQRSLINTDIDVQFGDNIITLVTCDYVFDNARFIVMARETRNGEEAAVDTTNAVLNPEPRYPKAWYDKKELPFPYESKEEITESVEE